MTAPSPPPPAAARVRSPLSSPATSAAQPRTPASFLALSQSTAVPAVTARRDKGKNGISNSNISGIGGGGGGSSSSDISCKKNRGWKGFGTSPRNNKQEQVEEIDDSSDNTSTLDGRLPLIGLKHIEKWEDRSSADSTYDLQHEQHQHQHQHEHVQHQRPSFIEAVNNKRTLLLKRLDQYTGLGTAFFRNGDSYSGEWKGGLQHGHGVYIFKMGDVYDGAWVEGQPTGHAIVRLSDGRRYKGDMSSFERQGYGIMWYLNGGRYEGQWDGNKKCGTGFHKSKNGANYQGQWKNNQRSGMGVFTSPETGVYYNGRWNSDKPQGLGEYRGPRGLRYRGHWKRGIPQGEGNITMTDGKFYNGQIVDGVPQGFGTMYDPYGSAFSGTWAAGVPSNDGAYQTPEGSVYGGSWNEGSWELSYGLINTGEPKDNRTHAHITGDHHYRTGSSSGGGGQDWTLQSALENPCARLLVIKYAQRCLQIENVWFLLRCQALDIRRLTPGTPELQIELNAIAADFISKTSPFELNVAGHQRDECLAHINMGTCSVGECLSDVRSEIFRMLEQNLWSQFKESRDYEEMYEIERCMPAGGDMFSYQLGDLDMDAAFDFTLT